MNAQLKTPLYQAVLDHAAKQPISFHVPGHKQGLINQPEANAAFKDLLQIDATELSGLDDLHAPEDVILEAETLLAELYQTEKSFFLVNGSTVGNLAMIMAVCEEDDHVLVQRNCHKSVLNALKLTKARPVFLEPEYNQDWKAAGGIKLETVKEAINLYPEAKAIILTYPNYYGLVNDLEGIITEAHLHHIPVLIDEAHGPHFIIGDPFPASATQMGADIVVQSAHKTLPAMTMGSFLHINSQLINLNKVKEYLGMLQSSSPSYPIMASLDIARNYLATYNVKDLSFFLTNLSCFKEELSKIPAIKVLDFPNNQGDPLKITIQSRCGLSGFELQNRLEQHSIYPELADPYNVLLILPLLKAGQSYPFEAAAAKIKQALIDIPVQELKEDIHVDRQNISGLAIPYKDMEKLPQKEVSIEKALDLVCAETVIPYPPGIPLLLKGEAITIDKLNQLNRLLQSGARFQGSSPLKKGRIKIFSTT
ncbi:aminotransferase class I/II-fold pyridoxal phosphate-dependent enzyme [Neobacillus vireti]|uniref:Lysine decarboxylase n=1 Tax=Neobacillus vireti LMG 21834 TaxID=1131730 RepID=A0AB94IFT0_9BACI|nr:aminotransferase class V-fold PLP-dependent enzyme [Neobacillus vireti]ETI65968.1 lysine decarboxylase [Neobacillus vireti LMG 21834]KLT15457.1 arginine decarboxylase [Neobacillus vireti]